MTDLYSTALAAATAAAWERHAQAIRYSLPGGCGGHVHMVHPHLLMAELAFNVAVREVVQALHGEDQPGADYTTGVMASAIQIADESVICEVESHGTPLGDATERIWDISYLFDPEEQAPEMIDMAERNIGYAVCRGLLEIDHARRWTVRILKGPAS
jgi:hypothetical protein